MKNFTIALLTVLLIGVVAYIILSNNGYTLNDLINKPKTIDLSVNCSDLNNLLIASELNITVTNNSSRTHNDVTVRVTAYDSRDNVVKEKTVTFDRTLEPNGTLTRPVSLPGTVKRCDCVVESSNPN